MRPISIAVGLVVISSAVIAVVSGVRLPDPRVQPAVAFLASKVQQHRLVAIGEHHGSTETQKLLAALLRRRNVAGVVNDTVVEFGNSRYEGRRNATSRSPREDPASRRRPSNLRQGEFWAA